jgi:tetratricopeptide (TPR) repeat protein
MFGSPLMSKRKHFTNKHPSPTRLAVAVLSRLPLGVPAGIMLIAVVIFMAYLPSINGGFVLDDGLLLTENKIINASDGLHRIWSTTESVDYWPATNTTFWIEWRLWGMHPAGYHVTNLILHMAESLLIWLILRKLSIPGAFLAALIFAVHPVNVESVAWIAQRKDLTAMLFFLLSILWYLKADMPTASVCMAPSPTVHCPLPTVHWPIFYWLSLAAFVLAVLGKGSAVILPLLLLGIVWWLRPLETVPISEPTKMGLSPFIRRHLLRTAPFFAIAVVLTLVNVWFQTHGKEAVIRNAGFAERLLGAGGVVWFYLYKALVPLNLVFIYPQWKIDAGNPLWWAPLLAALAVTAVLWRHRKGWGRPLLFAWGFFCVALAPVLGFQDVGFMKYSLVADRYQHIAIIGVIALASAGFGAWQKRTQGFARRIAPVAAIAVAGTLTFLTWRQSECYHDNITLYQSTLAINPECWMAHNNLGVNLARAGQLPAAIDHYQQALRLKDNYPEAHNNLGNALVRIGRADEAVEHYRQALRLQGDYPEAHDNLLNALAMTGQPEEAIEYYTQALHLNPDNPKTHFKLGNVFAHAGRQAEAINHYQRALDLEPEYAEAHVNLGNALTRTGRIDEAIDHYQQALRLVPDDNSARVNLISAYVRAGRSSEALAEAEKVLELARVQGQTLLAKQIEDWLNSYRADLSNPQNTPPPAQSAPPSP